MKDDSPFRHTYEALRFAFSFNHGNSALPPVAKMAGLSGGGRGLSGMDGAGYAGLVKAHVERLDDHRVWILTARFTPNSEPCSCKSACCSGSKPKKEWKDAIENLIGYVLEHSKGVKVDHYHLRKALIGRYFGVKTSFSEVSAMCGVDRDTASHRYSKIVALLGKDEKIAMFEIESKLSEAGLIPS